MAGAVSRPVELVFIGDHTRRYVIWEGEIVTHGFGALFPERYLPSRSAETSIWHCPVRTCGQAYATPPDLGDHFVRFHAGAILHDHLDGTFSVLPQDPATAYDANCQPYVASQGHMLPNLSLRQPSRAVPLFLGQDSPDTSAVAANRHDKSKPQTGNKPTSSSSEVNSDDESDGNESDGSDAGQSDTDDSDGSSDSESDGSDTDEAQDAVRHEKASETKLQSNVNSETSSDDSDTNDDESSGSKTDQQDQDRPARANIKVATNHLSKVGIGKEDTDRSPPATSLTRVAEDVKQRTNPPDCKYANSEVWKYITSFTSEFSPVPADPCLLELLILPRQRDLPYCWKRWLNFRKPSLKTLTAVALYLGGVQRNTPCGDIMRCAKYQGLYDELHHNGDKNAPRFHPHFAFDTCIQLPDYLRKVSPALEKRFRGYYCCNAYFRHTRALPMPGAFVDPSTQLRNATSKKRKADNDEVAPAPKKAKTSQAPVVQKAKKMKNWDVQDNRMSRSGTQPAKWETKWGKLPHNGRPLHSGPPLAYSSSMLSTRHVVDDYHTTFQIITLFRTQKPHIQANDKSLLFVVKQGAVSVWVTENQPFTISVDGCWSIKPGQSCSVKGMHPDTDTVIYIYGRPC
ncbi:uncharacterized protein B0T23DRAFT_433605 [Neurospora hispaniola]|uniref:C2H2-type domain-containing protein n=1 Tax=Neurospora hispaniola TaxID=588809 RepID=A0AAJ0IE75_9PEZI|nr:hypothetical protein B0T23DRAFT_433605 [Neurospora hispaniola]